MDILCSPQGRQKYKDTLTILKIESSGSHLFVEVTDNEEMNVNFSPVFIIDTRKKIFAVRMDIQFLNKGEKLFSESANVMVYFQTKEFDSVFSIQKEKIEAKDLDIIFRMLDTTVGIMRGVLFEQTKRTPLEGVVLPFIEMGELMTNMTIKVIGG